jgi:hypothetical protein
VHDESEPGGARGRLLMEQELADALGLPIGIARAMVKHQRLDGVTTEDGRYGAHEADIVSWRAHNPEVVPGASGSA